MKTAPAKLLERRPPARRELVRITNTPGRRPALRDQRSASPHADRPFVIINMAMSADGKIATASRRVSTFGSARDLAHLHDLRASADAVMCGASTAAAGIALGKNAERFRKLRLKRRLAEFPLSVVVSGSGSLSPKLALFRQRFSPVLVLTTELASPERLQMLRAVAAEVAVFGKSELDVASALRWLGEKWKVRRLLCEGGGDLNDALFRAGVVDELHLTICPLVFGGRTAPTISEGQGQASLEDAFRLRLKSRRKIGDELFLVFSANRAMSDQ